MPEFTGFKVLAWIPATPRVSALLVLMHPFSTKDGDIHRAYTLGANGYLVKPCEFTNTVALGAAIRGFWQMQNHATPYGQRKLDNVSRYSYPIKIRLVI
jgi:CheY-like chemotaxis protein